MSETKRSSIDDLTPFELISLAHAFFGGRRTAQILGYSFVWGLIDAGTGGLEIAEYRRRLIAMGWERTAAYRYFDDMRDFGKWLVERDFEPVLPVDLAKKLAYLASPVAHRL